MNVAFVLIPNENGQCLGRLPEKQTIGSAGYDLFSALDLIIQPGCVGLVKLGFKMSMEVGYEAQVRSRSGLALNKQIFVLNSPGTIDSDYRNEVGVILMNASLDPFSVQVGDRVAQMIFTQVENPCLSIVDGLDESGRDGGFGSTGMR